MDDEEARVASSPVGDAMSRGESWIATRIAGCQPHPSSWDSRPSCFGCPTKQSTRSVVCFFECMHACMYGWMLTQLALFLAAGSEKGIRSGSAWRSSTVASVHRPSLDKNNNHIPLLAVGRTPRRRDSFQQATAGAGRYVATHSQWHPQRSSSSRLSASSMATHNDDNASAVSLSLVDVDCNLWHEALTGILPATATTASDDDTHPQTIDACFDILQQDDLRNVVAMVAPSSTLSEAVRGVEALRHRATVLQNAMDTKDQRPALSSVRICTTVGVHPYHVKDEDEDNSARQSEDAPRATTTTSSLERTVNAMQAILESKPDSVAAVGECGLDASEGFPPLEDQIPWFQAQIKLAQQYDMPLFCHERLAFAETMQLLEHTTVPVIVHCFTGSVTECEAYMDRGYFVSVSGHVLRPDGESVRQCLQDGCIPLDKLMIETDAPYMGFVSCREAFLNANASVVASLNAKKRKKLTNSQYPNVPSSLTKVFQSVLYHINVGRLKRGETEMTEAELAAVTTKNANDFFRFGLGS